MSMVTRSAQQWTFVVLTAAGCLHACTTTSLYSNADLGGSTVVATPLNIPADGTSSATLVVTARRKSGSALPGLKVRLSGDGCRVTPAEVVSDANGRAIFTVTTPPEATGIRTLSASVAHGDFKAPLPMAARVNFFAPATGSSNGVAPGDDLGIGVVTDPGYGGTVHFVSSDPDATLPADYTFTASDLGVKVFIAGVILRTPGIQTVSAIDVATGKVLAVETFFVVVPEVAGSAVLRLVGLPTVLAAGAPASFSVDAQDGNGVARTGYTGLVAFSCTDPRAQIPPAHNFVAAEGATAPSTAPWCSRLPARRPSR